MIATKPNQVGKFASEMMRSTTAQVVFVCLLCCCFLHVVEKLIYRGQVDGKLNLDFEVACFVAVCC